MGQTSSVVQKTAKVFDQLSSYGLPVKLCDWLANFLSGRKVTVVVDDFSSSFHNINAGVPQGSPLSHRRAVGDLSRFYRYSMGFCSSELTSIIPPLSKPARCTHGASSSHPRAVVLHTSRTERYDRTFVPRVSMAWNGLPCAVFIDPASEVPRQKTSLNLTFL
nr:unnamed protein product [Callosobruchus chinensis]